MARRITPLIVLVAATAATFLALAAPVIGEIPVLFRQLVSSDDTRPPSWRIDEWLTAWRGLMAMNGPAAVVILGAAAVFSVQLIATRPTAQATAGRAGFLMLMLVGLAYTMAAGDDTARGLRNAQPTALCVPFLVVYCFDGVQQQRGQLTSRALQAALLAIAVWVVAPPVVQRAHERWAFIESHAAAVERTRARLLTLKRPGTRVAVWDGSPGSLLGEESFHFWGNYKYASDTFDEELLGMYPDFAFFRLREVPRIVHAEPGLGIQVDPQGRASDSGFGWLGRLWRRVFPRGDFKRNDEIVAGELSGVQVSVVALPEDEVNEELGESITEPELVALIERRFGPAVLRRESIAGVRWMVIEMPEKGGAQDR